jgi:chemotaxis-related protein WspD
MTEPASQSSNGARHLLDREPPADYLREWTERLAAEQKVAEPGTNSVVIFRIGFEWLALPTRVFHEVAEHCTLHTVPHRRGGVLAGLVNIRGELLLCASLGAVLELGQNAQAKKEKNRTVYERLLVANRDGNRLAFPVDEVHSIVRYHPRELKPLPATLEKAAATFTLGLLPWQEKTVGCLDDELLFYKLNKSFA